MIWWMDGHESETRKKYKQASRSFSFSFFFFLLSGPVNGISLIHSFTVRQEAPLDVGAWIFQYLINLMQNVSGAD